MLFHVFQTRASLVLLTVVFLRAETNNLLLLRISYFDIQIFQSVRTFLEHLKCARETICLLRRRFCYSGNQLRIKINFINHSRSQAQSRKVNGLYFGWLPQKVFRICLCCPFVLIELFHDVQKFTFPKLTPNQLKNHLEVGFHHVRHLLNGMMCDELFSYYRKLLLEEAYLLCANRIHFLL